MTVTLFLASRNLEIPSIRILIEIHESEWSASLKRLRYTTV